jgi:hypothetical protein
MSSRSFVVTAITLAAFAAAAPAAHAGGPYALFESGQVRPLAMAPHRPLVFAVNTPDDRLEVLALVGERLVPIAAVKVGLEPVAVAARNDREVWVVNHLSDSISVVDVSDPTAPRVTRTLLVGDEPRDIVFAGPGRQRAFVTTARRGQNSPIDPALTTPGVGRANVWVFDADQPGPRPRRHAAHDPDVVHRHPARAGGGPTAPPCTPPGSAPATAPPTVSSVLFDSRPVHAVPDAGAPDRRRRQPGAVGRPDRAVRRRGLARRGRPRSVEPASSSTCPTSDVFAIDADAAGADAPRPARSPPASARCSTTWR